MTDAGFLIAATFVPASTASSCVRRWARPPPRRSPCRPIRSAETEPNDDPAKAKVVTLPATLIGTIEKARDIDHFRFRGEDGPASRPPLETVAARWAHRSDGTLSVLEDVGMSGQGEDSDGSLDPL